MDPIHFGKQKKTRKLTVRLQFNPVAKEIIQENDVTAISGESEDEMVTGNVIMWQ